MPTAPYIIFGFDADPADPASAGIIATAHAAVPPLSWIGSLGVENVFLVELSPSQANHALGEIAHALWSVDQVSHGALRWFVQVCAVSDFAGGKRSFHKTRPERRVCRSGREFHDLAL